MSPTSGRLRVLYVINDLSVGGAQRVLAAQAAGLDRACFDAHVASLELIPGGSVADACRRAGLTVHPLAQAGEPRGIGAARLHGLVARLRPDVVHTHLAAAGVAGRIAARTHHVRRIVSTLHNVSDWTQRSGHPVRVADRASLQLARHIVAVSDAVRDSLLRLAPRLASRTVTIRNGIALDDYRAGARRREATRTAFGYAPGDLVVGAVARLEASKGIDTLIAAAGAIAPRTPELRLLIVGDGAERARLELLARRHGLGLRARFTGTRDDVPVLLGALDVFAAPSRSEGLGVAAIEALAAGVPVLASRVGGLPEVVEDGVCGRLLPPDETSVWATQLLEAAAHRGRLRAWGEAAVTRAGQFSLAASVAALEDLYVSAHTREHAA